MNLHFGTTLVDYNNGQKQIIQNMLKNGVGSGKENTGELTQHWKDKGDLGILVNPPPPKKMK